MIRLITKTVSTNKDLVVVPVNSKELAPKSKLDKASALSVVEQKSGIRFRKLLADEGFLADDNTSTYFRTVGKLSAKAILFIGWNSGQNTAEEYRKLGALVAKTARCHRVSSLAFSEGGLQLTEKKRCKALLEGVALSEYQFDSYQKKPKTKPVAIKTVTLLTRKKVASQVAKDAEIYAQAACLARDLVNMPATDCDPPYMVRIARKIAREDKLKIKVLDKPKLEKMKAGGILGVNRGSATPPALIKLTYKPRGKAKKVVSLVGKGVTFDTGGHSIKINKSMNDMKMDMGGAAAVLGAMSGIGKLKPNIEVRAYVPVVENMVSAKSYKLGDVLRMYSGKSVEVLNTDAEGRLILADALALAEKEGCDQIIDLATLTGACMAALGQDYAGLFTRDDSFGQKIIESGSEQGECIWQLPLVEKYREQIKSDVADIKNVGFGYGGAITAALFLSEFVEKTPWVHLDIAGPAFLPAAADYSPPGATGFGVRTLIGYIMSL